AGAFMTAIIGAATGNFYIGLIAAPIAGALVSVLLAVFTIKYRVDQIIVGVVLNVLVLGLTNYLFSTVLTQNQSLRTPPPVGAWRIPLLADIPVIGQALFNQNVIVYTMIVGVFALQFMIFRSRWGLRMRSVGEHPKAADTVGIKVNRTRYRNILFGGAVAGFGGAAIVSAGLAFTKEATQGRGYIALAAMILGRWNPTGALAAAVLFGFFDSLRRVLGNIGSVVPSVLLAMLRYLATLFAVAGVGGRLRPPAAEGQPSPPDYLQARPWPRSTGTRFDAPPATSSRTPTCPTPTIRSGRRRSPTPARSSWAATSRTPPTASPCARSARSSPPSSPAAVGGSSRSPAATPTA